VDEEWIRPGYWLGSVPVSALTLMIWTTEPLNPRSSVPREGALNLLPTSNASTCKESNADSFSKHVQEV